MSQQVKQLLEDCEQMISSHRTTKKVFNRLYQLAELALSHEDAGRILVEELGSEAAVRTWCEQHQALTQTILTKWYMGARLHTLEQQRKTK
jgi:hypothetical protein